MVFISKKDSNTKPENYCAVSILPAATSNYLKKGIKVCVLKFLNKNNPSLYKQHYGFKQCSSTFIAVIDIKNCLRGSLTESLNSEYQKIFDTVDYKVLIEN